MQKHSKPAPKIAASWSIEGPGFVLAKGAYSRAVYKAFRRLFSRYNLTLEKVAYPSFNVAAGKLTVKLFSQDDVKTMKECLLEKKPYVSSANPWPFTFIKRGSEKMIDTAFDTLRESIIR